ncbi:tRNA pseudouridine(55) synthase TruB [Flavobacteriaceae bacterium]|nr:tRNA pseudouridine(55) synthase TruB [Flavobacteriaceae bacterium]
MSYFNFATESYWLNINKPRGVSSARVVAIVKRLTKAKKVGHAGTLDPLAEGVLPIAVNNATRTAEFIVDCEKEYLVTIKWGEFRDTDDMEGKIEFQNNHIPKTSTIINSLSNFIGDINQIPSKFSAIKINGVRSYKMASKKIDYTIPSREVRIKKIHLIDSIGDKSNIIIGCSKGTYIRSFVRDLANSLSVYGCVFSLKRTVVGSFNDKGIISLDKLKTMVRVGRYCTALVQLEDALCSMMTFIVSNLEAKKLRNGQKIFLSNVAGINRIKTCKIKFKNHILGIGEILDDTLTPKKIFL